MPSSGSSGGLRPVADTTPESDVEKLVDTPVVDEALVKAVDALGSAIAKPTLQVIDALVLKPTRTPTRKQLAQHHFWCDLFATLAQAIKLFEDALDKVPEWVTDAILTSEHHKKRTLIIRPIVKAAVTKAWGAVEQLIEQSFNHKKARLALQLLAILCCPALENHRTVMQYCVVPVGNMVLEKEIKERLKAALPPELTEGLDPESEPPPSSDRDRYIQQSQVHAE